MSQPHDEIVSHARAHLLRSDTAIAPKMVDAFLASNHFKHFVTVCDNNLAEHFRKYLADLQHNEIAQGAQPVTAATDDGAASMRPPARYEFADLATPAPKEKRSEAAEPVKQVSEQINTENRTEATVPVTASESVPGPTDASPGLPTATTAPAPPVSRLPGADQPAAQLTATPNPVKPANIAPPPQKMLPLPNAAFRLTNARAGENYEQRITLQTVTTPELIFQSIVLPEGVGLSADVHTGMVSGIPATAGDYTVEVRYYFKDEGVAHSRRGTVPLLVNADPKSLWKDTPSDKTGLFWKADATSELVVGPDFRIVAASKRGRSHAHVGSFRDDDFYIRHADKSGWYVAIVADGAGSAKYSRRGAQLVCEQAGASLTASLNGPEGDDVATTAEAYHRARDEGTNPKAVEAARQALRNAVYKTVGHAAFHAVKAIQDTVSTQTGLNAAYKDFSTTALISASRRFPFGTLCVAYWVGDGAVAIYTKDRGIQLLGDVDSGEFSGQTRFLDSTEVTQEALLRRTRFELVDDMTALILMTDGVSDPKFETEANLARPNMWDALWQDLNQSIGLHEATEGLDRRLLLWLDFWSQGNHDDRTIAIVY